MARIRSIKPEFWDSPDVARASAVARLCFIGMWNWADDHGRGTANLKEMEGFIFPNDDVSELSSGKSANFRDVVAEVAGTFGVVFYTVRGRPYYEIPSWESHQRNEKRAHSKYPGPNDPGNGPHPHLTRDDADSSGNARNLRDTVAENLGGSDLGTGEQGNRGTGIVAESDDSDDGPSKPDKNDRDDIRSVLDHLDQKLQEYDPEARLPNRTQANLDAARLLLDRDSRTVDQVKAAIDYSQDSEFWRPNIRSMSKLRDKYETLRAQAQSTGQRNGTTQPQPTGSLLWDDEARKKAHERPSYLTDTDHI